MGDRSGSDPRWEKIWELFHRLLEQPAGERTAMLETACGGDDELRSEVEELLTAHEKGLSVLDDSPTAHLAHAGGGGAVRTDREPLQPGTVLAGRFEIEGLLGAGGAGEVYAARDLQLGIRVAVKTLLSGLASDAAALARFRKEILLARQVTHRNACRLFDVVSHGDSIFLTMELLEGETLAAKLRRQGRLPTGEALEIVAQLVAGLEAAHAVGVVHRDLKPSNVLLVEEPSGVRVVITDFGLATSDWARSAGVEHLTRSGDLVGTPAYMAPEQLEGREVGPETDIYALGLLLYEMVTGRLPFAGSSALSLAAGRLAGPPPPPRSFRPDLGRRWERVILRCLEPQPQARYRSAGDVVAALHGRRVPGRRWGRLRRTAVAAAALLVLGLLSWAVVPPRFEDRAPPSAGLLGFEARDGVLVAAFDNRTREEVFDGSLEAALSRELAGSRFVSVVPRPRIADTLRLMQQPQDARLDAALAREVALRDGGIRAVVTGSVERLGAAYVLSAELVEPASWSLVASVSEEADGFEAVTEATRRLSSRLRRALGESLPSIRESERELVAVSTPSLRALKLYSQADLLLSQVGDAAQWDRERTAVQLLRDAIAEDPGFASAYTHLAHAVNRAATPWERRFAAEPEVPEEALELSQRALELADGAGPAERYFIRGSHFTFLGRHEEALEQYRALLALEPDHFWANVNAAYHLASVGRHAEMAELSGRAARARPNQPIYSARAAGLLLSAGKLAQARELAARVVELQAQVPGYVERWSWLEMVPIHELWLRGEIDEVVETLDARVAAVSGRAPEVRGESVLQAIEVYLDLGMLRRAEELHALYEPSSDPDGWTVKMAWRRWQPEVLSSRIKVDETLDPESASRRALQLARLGLAAEAGRVLDGLPEEFTPSGGDYPFVPSHYEARVALARGTLAAEAGRFEEAIPLLETGLEGLATGMGPVDCLLGSETLARVLEEVGRRNEALAVLEEASAQRARVMWGRHYWLRVRLRLLELYRELGRRDEAEAIERELENLLSRADDDFPLLVELRALQGRFHGVAGRAVEER